MSSSALLDAARILHNCVLDVLWRQWAAIGAMISTDKPARSIVDPEALMLVSLEFVDHEARLADLMSDWIIANADLLSVQRIGNLKAEYSDLVRQRLSSIAHIAVTQGKDARWRKLGEAAEAERLLSRASGAKAARAARLPVTNAGALLLRLRLIFGVGIKSDVFGYLLGTPPKDTAIVRGIATSIGYQEASVRRALGDLTDALVVEKSDETKRTALYWIPKGEWERALLITATPVWRDWHERFVYFSALKHEAKRSQDNAYSPYVTAVKCRELLDKHSAAFLFAKPKRFRTPSTIEQYPETLFDRTQQLCDWMKKSC